jgi:glyoxylase-like metal-dependent hydrolase (beta-lactamase superfamily II)
MGKHAMKIANGINIVASGDAGFSLTHPDDCTVYLIDGGGALALIDAGSGLDSEAILREIRTAGFEPRQVRAILLTHGHGDHAGGARALSEACSAAVYAMEPAAGFVRAGDVQALSLAPAIEAGVYPRGYRFPSCPVEPLADGESIQIGDVSITAHLTEGHSAGHACYLCTIGGRRCAFVGDAITHGGRIALQPIWDCDLKAYIATVHRLAGLAPDALFPGHGCVTLNRGMKQIGRALDRLNALKLPWNAIE